MTILVLSLSCAGFLGAAPDGLEDSFAMLKKEVEGAKDPDALKNAALETSKLARAMVASTQPTDAEEIENWKQRVEFAKGADAYSEYALSIGALQPIDPAKAIDLVDTLISQNPKTAYLAQCAGAYLIALGKMGGDKQLSGATRLIGILPESEEALYILVNGSRKTPDIALGYSNRLIAVMSAKAKPEGVPDADWELKKSTLLGTANFVAGTIEGDKQMWPESDRHLRASLPFVTKDQQSAAAAYFYLGLANYQMGKATGDKNKLQDAAKYSDLSAAIKGPYQETAGKNSTLIKKELGVGPPPAKKKK